MKNSDKIILDLCGGTGSWSKPYKNAGYDVRVITLPEYDVRTYEPPENVYGILAAPPCTMFSLARTKANKPRNLKEGMETVRACLNIIWKCMEIKQETKKKTLPLKFWALENPNGMLKYFLGKPAFEFNPYDFGDMYKKETFVWGNFNKPKKLITKQGNNLYSLSPQLKIINKSMVKFDQLKTKEIHGEFYDKLTRTERRAITPAGFAKAFFEKNQ